MNGQWMGEYDGSNRGLLVVDFDDIGTHYEGRAYAYDNDKALPGTVAFIRSSDKATRVQATIPLLPIDPRTRKPSSWNDVAPLFPDVTFPERADIDITWSGDALTVQWTNQHWNIR